MTITPRYNPLAFSQITIPYNEAMPNEDRVDDFVSNAIAVNDGLYVERYDTGVESVIRTYLITERN